jgi:hypothetical protein
MDVQINRKIKKMEYTITQIGDLKFLRSANYNYVFNCKTGFFARFGENKSDDPLFSPYGPEILDIEVSTICHGINNTPCKFCYKGNSGIGKNMTLSEFQTIFLKMPKTLTQVAFGIGDIDSNPDLYDMFRFCRENDYNKVVPNVTINGWNLGRDDARVLSELCGAIAVSRYLPVDSCYNSVKTLTDFGMTQVNLHVLLSNETYDDCVHTIIDAKKDVRLKNLNAVVFLMLKPHGRGVKYNKVSSFDKYKKLIDFAEKEKVRIGFDSCSALSFLNAVKDHEKFERFKMLSEPCESSLFSSYINVSGDYFPCSFCEGEFGWENGISVISDKVKDFTEVWLSDRVIEFRKKLLNCLGNNQSCPMYNLDF